MSMRHTLCAMVVRNWRVLLAACMTTLMVIALASVASQQPTAADYRAAILAATVVNH